MDPVANCMSPYAPLFLTVHVFLEQTTIADGVNEAASSVSHVTSQGHVLYFVET